MRLPARMKSQELPTLPKFLRYFKYASGPYKPRPFQDFDEDFNMALSREELERVLAERFLVKPRENFPKLFFKFDVDKSGGLDLTEYMKFDAEFPFDQTDPVGGKPSKVRLKLHETLPIPHSRAPTTITKFTPRSPMTPMPPPLLQFSPKPLPP